MAGTPVRRASDEAAFYTRFSGATSLALLIPPLLIAGLVMARVAPVDLPIGLAGAVETATPAELTAVAATTIEHALGPNGSGISFEIVQRQAIVARLGGPPVELPDPTNPDKTIVVPEDEIGILVSRGFATPDGFWSELRHGPEAGQTEPFVYERAELSRQALKVGDTMWRNDGAGWHETDRLPGIGLDPVSIALLPRLLREATEVKDADAARTDLATRPDLAGLAISQAEPARTLDGQTTVADVPAIVAVDLAAFTELRGPARLSFDDAGRLIGLTVVASNTHLDTWDLVIETAITFAYPTEPPRFPEPSPVYVEPTPLPDEEGES